MYEPVILSRKSGGFLAVAPLDSPVRIAVTAATEDAARIDFRAAIERWDLLLRSATDGSEAHDKEA